jgi:hypothetical protein
MNNRACKQLRKYINDKFKNQTQDFKHNAYKKIKSLYLLNLKKGGE